jgi:hypothetical protein
VEGNHGSRLLSTDATNPHQLLFVRCHDAFNGSEFEQEAMRERRTYSRKALQHIEPRALQREQSSICKGKREIGIRLPLDNNAAVNPIIADGQVPDVHREVVALAGEIDQSGMPLRGVDQELMTRQRRASRCWTSGPVARCRALTSLDNYRPCLSVRRDPSRASLASVQFAVR